MTKVFRRDIQILRGIAVIVVVLFHAFESIFPFGYLGVDIFFVISGFVVTPLILRIHNEKFLDWTKELKRFYIKRFYRLAPALATTLIISAFVITLFGNLNEHQKFTRQGIASALLIGNLGAYRYSGDYFSPNPNPLVHTWSLSVEEQIYIFLPVVLFILMRKSRNLVNSSIKLFSLITTLSILSFLNPTFMQPIYSLIGTENPSQISFYSPFDRVWQFTLGGLTYLFSVSRKNRIKSASFPVNFMMIFCLFYLILGRFSLELSMRSILVSILTALIIYFESLNVLLKNVSSVLNFLGDRSYSIYLFHMPLIYVAKFSPVFALGSSKERYFQSAVAALLSILVGSICYSKIENRFRYKSKLNVSSRRIKNMVATTLLLPIILLSAMDFSYQNKYWGLDRNITQPEYPGYSDSDCARDSGFSITRPCLYNEEEGPKTILLIGDSHAGHISQAVIDAAKKSEWKAVVWTHGSCHFQFQDSTGSKRVPDGCLNINREIYSWVERNNPDLIIVSQYVHNETFLDDLQSALLILKNISPEILLIENNPIFPDVDDFMVSRPLIMPAYDPPRTFPKVQMNVTDKQSSDQISSWARRQGIATMNFESIFCNSHICSRYLNSQWLYMDEDHLSLSGAALTIPLLERHFKNFSQ